MSPRSNTNKLEGQSLGLFIFECVMALLYLAFGVLFLFTDLFSTAINGWVRIALGVLIGIYGIFRIFRAMRKVLSGKA